MHFVDRSRLFERSASFTITPTQLRKVCHCQRLFEAAKSKIMSHRSVDSYVYVTFPEPTRFQFIFCALVKNSFAIHRTRIFHSLFMTCVNQSTFSESKSGRKCTRWKWNCLSINSNKLDLLIRCVERSKWSLWIKNKQITKMFSTVAMDQPTIWVCHPVDTKWRRNWFWFCVNVSNVDYESTKAWKPS